MISGKNNDIQTYSIFFMFLGFVVGVSIAIISYYIKPLIRWKNKLSRQYFWYIKSILGSTDFIQREENGYAVWRRKKLSNTFIYKLEVRDSETTPISITIKLSNMDRSMKNFTEINSYIDVSEKTITYKGKYPYEILFSIWKILKLSKNQSIPYDVMCVKNVSTDCVNFSDVLSYIINESKFKTSSRYI